MVGRGDFSFGIHSKLPFEVIIIKISAWDRRMG